MNLVIFDCDGVLVNTEAVAARVGASVLNGMGWNLSVQEVIDRFLGCTDEYLRAEVEAHFARPLPEDWDEQFESQYVAAYTAELRPVDGVVKVLDELLSDGVPTCVASNGSHDKIRRTLGTTGLFDRFEGRIFSVQDVPRGKPAPDIFLHAAKSMRVFPQDCVVVEDSPQGVAAARSAGMACIGFADLTPAHKLAAPGVTVCSTMTDVLRQLRRIATAGAAREGGTRGTCL